MAFLDATETSMANRKLMLMRSIEDTAIVLDLKPFEELEYREERLKQDLSFKRALVDPGTMQYHLCKYLEGCGHWTFANFSRDMKDYKHASESRRKEIAVMVVEKYFSENADCGVDETTLKENSAGSKNSRSSLKRRSTMKSQILVVNFKKWVLANCEKQVTYVKERVEKADKDLFRDLVEAVGKYLESQHREKFYISQWWKRQVQIEAYIREDVKPTHFDRFRVLGRGAFGAVMCVQKKDTLAVYAMKEMSKKRVKLRNDAYMVVEEKKMLMKGSGCPFVLSLNYALHDEETLYLLFQMCTGGDLRFHLDNEEKKLFDPARAKFYTAEILLGLAHLHSLDIVYRDLKPANVLLDKTGHVVISDLGLCLKLKPDKLHKGCAGTARYWAPEIVAKKGTYKQCDFWTLGICLYEFLAGRKPKPKDKLDLDGKKEWSPMLGALKSEENALDPDGILNTETVFPSQYFPDDAADLLKKLFETDPLKRIGANSPDEIKKHPWFSDLDWGALANKEVTPPFVPDASVNASDLDTVGTFDTKEADAMVLDSKDEKWYRDFYYASSRTLEQELLLVLKNMDKPPPEATAAPSGCCTLL